MDEDAGSGIAVDSRGVHQDGKRVTVEDLKAIKARLRAEALADKRWPL